MSNLPRHHTRNLGNIDLLAPNTKQKALQLYSYALRENMDVLIYETMRSMATQVTNVKRGTSDTLKSYHLVGQALDFVFIDPKGNALWGRKDYQTPQAKKFVAYAKGLGFTWGGDWTSFVDSPHLQYNYKGYGLDKRVDSAVIVKKPAVKKATSSHKVYTSLVDYLKGNGQDSTFAARCRLAGKYGIDKYTGTASQNVKLLGLLQK